MAPQITSFTIVYSTVIGCRSKKTSKIRVTGLCAGNSSVTGEFPASMASNAENVSICCRLHDQCRSEDVCPIWDENQTHRMILSATVIHCRFCVANVNVANVYVCLDNFFIRHFVSYFQDCSRFNKKNPSCPLSIYTYVCMYMWAATSVDRLIDD